MSCAHADLLVQLCPSLKKQATPLNCPKKQRCKNAGPNIGISKNKQNLICTRERRYGDRRSHTGAFVPVLVTRCSHDGARPYRRSHTGARPGMRASGNEHRHERAAGIELTPALQTLYRRSKKNAGMTLFRHSGSAHGKCPCHVPMSRAHAAI